MFVVLAICFAVRLLLVYRNKEKGAEHIVIFYYLIGVLLHLASYQSLVLYCWFFFSDFYFLLHWKWSLME